MFFFLLFLIIVIKCLTYVWGQRKIISLHFKLKNDIRCYPIIGHAYLFFGTDEDRMTALQLVGKEAIKHGGLSRVWIVHKMMVVVADPKIAETIFRECLEKADVMNISQNLLGNASFIAPVSTWRPRRKVLTPAFTPKHLNYFLTIFDKNSRTMVGQLASKAGQGPFSIWKYIAAYSMDSVCESTLDYQAKALWYPDQPFLQAFEEYIQMSAKRFFTPWYYNETVYSTVNWKIKKHIKIMHDFVDEIIKAKRKELALAEESEVDTNPNDLDRRNTLLDLLINKTFNREGYTDVELREELLVIILAGSDTSATGVAFTLLMLAMYPDIQEKVYEELQDIFGSSLRSATPEDLTKMKYLNAVIKETLRLYPSIPSIVRRTIKDVILPTGLILPKDTDIILSLCAINRNPQYWGENAEQFDPTRFLDPLPHPAAFVSFSYGPRNCIGYQYALMSIKTVISTLLRRFRILPARESNGTKPPRVKFDVMMKDVDDFCIKLEKRP